MGKVGKCPGRQVVGGAKMIKYEAFANKKHVGPNGLAKREIIDRSDARNDTATPGLR